MTATNTIPISKTRPEAELILCCTRTRLDAKKTLRIGELVRQGLDWDYVLRTAQRHGVMPLLYRHLKDICPEAVPPGVRERLRTYFHNTTRRNLLRAGELCRLLRLFESHGISAIALKGPALTILAYGNLALRPFCDLDILVHSRDLSQARHLLLSQGYQALSEVSGVEEKAMIQTNHHQVFMHCDHRSAVELHWAIAERYISFSLDFEHLWERRKLINIAGTKIPMPAPEDLLLILCAHGTKHLWQQLKWICDIAELIHAHQQINWSVVAERARALGWERMLHLGLFLAHDLLGATVPPNILQKILRDSTIKSLAPPVYQLAFEDSVTCPGHFDSAMFRIAARERLRDKSRYCLRRVMTPGRDDRALLLLPPTLFPLYYLIRPLRLTGKYAIRSSNILRQLGRKKLPVKEAPDGTER